MRAILLVLILAILALIAAVATGLLDLNLVRGAKAPEVSATSNGVTAKGGQAPAFEIETGSVKVGTKPATVQVPTIAVEPPKKDGQDPNQAATTGNAAQ
jgi:hypothetical protein